MSGNIGDKRNLLLKLKTKLGLYHVKLRSKDSPEKITLTLVETQQLTDIEKSDSKNEISCLKWTIYNGRRKVCINFQTVRQGEHCRVPLSKWHVSHRY